MDYPLKLQQSWLEDEYTSILSSTPHGKKFTNSVVVKNFVTSLLIKSTPILFVVRFLKITSDLSVVAILSDSKHLIHGIIPYKTCKEFEYKYGKRITFEMSGTLIQLKKADFQFATSQQLQELGMEPSKAVITIQINELSVFQRDQVELSWMAAKHLRFLYEDVVVANEMDCTEEDEVTSS
ncbi:telomere replication protein Est3p [[Candida] railenensis]|uniref:Telomere replication protein EST3 n=1 Tax=[Candida] railenensis TaxID=45579 RepID=A0A9P0QRT2_9ASCO|nr:telomere replication protein Est3p [[Candida] railenensis]